MSVAEIAIPYEDSSFHETPPLREPEAGVDERVARKFRLDIIDETRELPAPKTGRTTDEIGWTWEDVKAFGQLVCILLDRDPNGPNKKPPTLTQLHRAARTLDGPGPSTIYNVRRNGVRELHRELGFKPHIGAYESWGYADVQVGAQALVEENGGRRPSVKQVEEAARKGDFPGMKFLYANTDGVSGLHELIGLPSGKGWRSEDWIDWGVAFKIQNGPEAVITFNTIELLSRRQTAPSARSLYDDDFSRAEDFDRAADLAYRERIIEDHILRQKQRGMIKQLRQEDETFEELTDLMTGEELRRVWGGYHLLNELVPSIDPSLAADLAVSASAYEIADWIISYHPDWKLVDIKNKAQEHEVANTLWPYRFYNADLIVEDPRRKPVPEIIFEDTENEQFKTTSEDRLKSNRLRRLARLATHGLGTGTDEVFVDTAKFAKQGGELSSDDMHELQAIIRRADRKAKRLELLGDEIDDDERILLEAAIRLGDEVKTRFVEANRGLVTYLLVRKFGGARTGEQLDEILHAGQAGLVKALYKFDPDKGFKFSTYAQWWVTNYAFACARLQNFGISLSQDDEAMLRSATNRTEGLALEPEAAKLANIKNTSSLDTPETREKASLHETRDLSTEAAEAADLTAALATLTQDERLVVLLQYRLDDYTHPTNHERERNASFRSDWQIARHLGWPQDKVTTLLEQAWEKLAVHQSLDNRGNL